MIWNRYIAYPLEKGQGKEGTGSKRLIHIFCPAGSAWQHTSLQRGTNKQPSWTHKCITGKSTDGAIMVSLATAWRLRQCRRDSVTTNYDCSNAFGSVAWEPLLAGITALTTEADVQYHSEQTAQQAFLLTASADNTTEMQTDTFRPRQGSSWRKPADHTVSYKCTTKGSPSGT